MMREKSDIINTSDNDNDNDNEKNTRELKELSTYKKRGVMIHTIEGNEWEMSNTPPVKGIFAVPNMLATSHPNREKETTTRLV